MIKNYCIKVISSVFIMLTIVLVSSSVFASDTETIIYDKFEFVVDKTNSTITATNTETGLTQLYTLSGDISGYSNYIMTYSDRNDHGYLEDNSFGILFCNNYSWYNYSISGVKYSQLYANGFFVSFQNRLSTSKEKWDLPWGTIDSCGFTVSSYNDVGSRGQFWFLYTENGYDSTKGQIVSTSFSTISNPLDSNENIYEVEKKIIYQVNYAEDNKTAILSAEIKNGAEGDKLYYSTLGYSLTGKLMNPIELNQSQATAITLNRNTMIHLQALDAER